MPLNIELFQKLVKDTLSLGGNIDSETNLRMIQSVFGCGITIMATLWFRLSCEELLPWKAKPIHLLIALAFLKTYETEDNYVVKFGVTRNTHRKWTWDFIAAISKLDIVSTAGTRI